MKVTTKVGIGSMIGAAAIQLALLACDSPSEVADAAAAPSDCTRWQLSSFRVDVPAAPATGFDAVVDIPEGWEPFQSARTPDQFIATIRRCAP